MIGKIRVKIDSMAFGGYGVARSDGKVLFVPYSVAGDEVSVEVIEEKKNYSLSRLVEILKPSPWRVKPPCPYFGVCGGCQWQHIDYSKHGELKREILEDILKRLGGLQDTPPIHLGLAPSPYDYRTRVQLKVKQKAMGYYKERSHEIIDVGHCPIAHPLVNQIIPLLRESLLLFSQIQEIEINVSPEEEKGILILHPRELDRGVKVPLKKFLNGHPVLKGLALIKKKGKTILGEPYLSFTIPLNLTLQTSPGSFSQVNLKQNGRLIQKVLEFSEVKKHESVLDLYAGIGNLSLPLAISSKEVWGVEENLAAVNDARFNAKENGIENFRIIHGRVEEVLKEWKRGSPDLIVLDPPRAGCKTILDRVAGLGSERIVYVSCEPTTLARDLRLLFNKRYSLRALGLIDMFPQSYHMEVVGLLEHS